MNEKEARVLIYEFEEAVRKKAWRGTEDSREWTVIDSNYIRTKKELLECLLKPTTDLDSASTSQKNKPVS